MKPSLRERVARLEDELRNGIKWDRKRNIYYLVWTARQVRNARRRGARLAAKLRECARHGNGAGDYQPPHGWVN